MRIFEVSSSSNSSKTTSACTKKYFSWVYSHCLGWIRSCEQIVLCRSVDSQSLDRNQTLKATGWHHWNWLRKLSRGRFVQKCARGRGMCWLCMAPQLNAGCIGMQQICKGLPASGNWRWIYLECKIGLIYWFFSKRRIADKQACCITYTLESEPLDRCLATNGTTNVEPEATHFHDLPYPCYFCQALGWDRWILSQYTLKTLTEDLHSLLQL